MNKNRPLDRTKVSNLASMLEGLDFPADKPKKMSHVNQNLSGVTQDSEIVQKLQNNFTNNKRFNKVYEIEKQARLETQEK